MSRFLTPNPDQQPRNPRRSAYEDRPGPEREWVTVAETDQFTGQLVWEPDWAQRVSGWTPIDEFPRRR